MRIGLIGNNSVEYIEHLLDIWNSNDSAVLIDSSAPPSMAFSMLSEAHAEECYVERPLFDDCACTPPSLKVHLYSQRYCY